MQTFLSILFRINHQKQESSNRKTLNIYCVAMCDVLDKQWSCCTYVLPCTMDPVYSVVRSENAFHDGVSYSRWCL